MIQKLVSFITGVFVGVCLLVCAALGMFSLLLSLEIENVQKITLNEAVDSLILNNHRNDSSAFYGQLILTLNETATQETFESMEYRRRVQEMQRVNSDVVGWITIPDLEIDYPVLYSTSNKTYLRTDINGEYDVHGCIYLDAFYGNIYSPIKLIHGHNMRDGTMFAKLPSMLKWETLDEAPSILYYDSLGLKEFKVFSIFSVNSEEESVLVDEYTSLAELEDIIDGYAERSWVSCTYQPEGLETLMLNTCWYGESGQERHLHCIVVASRVR